MAAVAGGLRGGRDRRGQILLVRYQGFPVYHQRLVLGNLESSNDEFWVLTPDFDRYMEMYDRAQANITDVVWANADGTRPVGLPANTQIYRFAAWPTNEILAGWYAEALTKCREADRRRGVMAAAIIVPAGGGAPVPAAGIGPGPLLPAGAPQVGAREGGGSGLGAFLRPPGADGRASEKWVSLATLTLGNGDKVKRGDVIQVDGSTQSAGRYGVHGVGDDAVPVFNLMADDLEEFRCAESEYDARLVPLKRGGAGERHYDWRPLCDLVTSFAYKDWPVQGPRTVAWVCRFLTHLGRTPTEHHRSWKQLLRLSDSGWGVDIHRVALEVLEVSGSYDQLNLANIAGLEKLLREAQFIEWQYAESAKKQADGGGDGGKKPKGGGKGDVLVSGELQLFTGKHKEYGNIMISPELLEYVAKEAEKEVNVMKQVRKAREERALSRKDA